MRKKVFLLALLLFFMSSCFEECPPTKPEDEEEILTHGDIDAHYYRMATEIAEGSDVVRIFMSWMNYQSKTMNKVEEDHFHLDLKRVPNNADHRGDYESAHFIRIVDGRRGKNVADKIVLNGIVIPVSNATKSLTAICPMHKYTLQCVIVTAYLKE